MVASDMLAPINRVAAEISPGNASIFPVELYENIIDWFHQSTLGNPIHASPQIYPTHQAFRIRVRTLSACALTCRAWYPISQIRLVSYMHFSIYGSSIMAPIRLARVLQAQSWLQAHVKFLTVDFADPTGTLLLLLPLLPALENLRLLLRETSSSSSTMLDSRWNPELLTALLLCSPSLRVLELRCRYGIRSEGIRGSTLVGMLARLRTLTSVTFSYLPSIRAPQNPAYFKFARHRQQSNSIQNLAVFGAKEDFTPLLATLLHVPAMCSSLTHLTIRLKDEMDVFGSRNRYYLTRLFLSCRQSLVELDIHFLTDHFFEDWSFLSHLSSIRRLCIESLWLPHITLLSSITASLSTHTLEELTLRGPPRIIDTISTDERDIESWRELDSTFTIDPKFRVLKMVYLPYLHLSLKKSMQLWGELLPRSCERGIVRCQSYPFTICCADRPITDSNEVSVPFQFRKFQATSINIPREKPILYTDHHPPTCISLDDYDYYKHDLGEKNDDLRLGRAMQPNKSMDSWTSAGLLMLATHTLSMPGDIYPTE
ncbi:hypothetical protein K474DRAFT_1407613 [Panus rudis PR-1116 ss-1]|nr:hypothetical protein K474DRAFT_1407613 [Panus rudis PR-1116 ss-1]